MQDGTARVPAEQAAMSRRSCRWSGREDSNLRPLGPQPSALPDCATPRPMPAVYDTRGSGDDLARSRHRYAHFAFDRHLRESEYRGRHGHHPAGRRDRVQEPHPDHRYDEFIEGFARLMESRGIPRAAGRIFSFLQVSDPPEQTAAQIATALGISLGTVSSMTRLLMQAGWVERISRRGERQARYRSSAGMMSLTVDGVMEPTRRARQLTQRGLELMADRPAADRARLDRAQRRLCILRGVAPNAPRAVAPTGAERSAMTAAIQTEKLTKSYGSHRGIIEVDLEVQEGEAFGFLGPNGAGKTTMIRTLLDHIRPTSGRATIFGIDTTADPVAIHRRLGYLPGEFVLYDKLTGGQTIGVLRQPAWRRGPDLPGRSHRAPGRRPIAEVPEYSKGNKQKIGLIIALQHRPDLLHARRADLRPRPAGAAGVLRGHPARGQGRGPDRLPLLHILSEVEKTCDRVGDHPRRPPRAGGPHRGAA